MWIRNLSVQITKDNLLQTAAVDDSYLESV